MRPDSFEAGDCSLDRKYAQIGRAALPHVVKLGHVTLKLSVLVLHS
jgi:hypothetical protein